MFKTHSSGACASSTDWLVRENVLVGLVTTQIVTKKEDKTGSVEQRCQSSKMFVQV